MNNSFRLALEQFKKDARFKIGLPPEQAETLFQQIKPIGEALETYQAKTLSIRKNSMLSDAGKNAEVDQARKACLDAIVEHAAKVDRNAVINDLAQRINTKVVGARERAQKAFPPDAALLAQELRLHVIPRALADAKMQQIPAHQALGRMAVRAAEGYAGNMAKSEIVLQACGTGWPWVPTSLTPETMAQVEATIGAQVAADEMSELKVAQGVQKLLNRVIDAAQQSLKELG